MYFRLLTNLCKRSLYRPSSNVGLQVGRLCHAAAKNEEKREVETASIKFPDYKIIYSFPYIRYVSAMNVTKYRLTIFILAFTPAMAGLNLMDIVPFDITSSCIASGVLVTLWVHSFTILCNNLIGYVYVKDKQKVILSYVDYWGKRIDLETTIDDIIPISDNPISITDSLYKKVIVSSLKPTLKINMKLGRIINADSFKYILGTD